MSETRNYYFQCKDYTYQVAIRAGDLHIDSLVQDYSNSSELALELL